MQNEPKITSLSRDTPISHYNLREVLDIDQFSITYNAWDTKQYRLLTIIEYFPEEIASREDNANEVKVKEDHLADYQEGLDRFLNNAKTIANFNHPNIIKVLDYFQLNNTAYQCIPHEQGLTLDQLLIQQNRILPEEKLKSIFIAMLNMLQYLHKHNFYHKNITLRSIYIRKQGEPFLIISNSVQQTTSTNSVDDPIAETQSKYGSWNDLYALGETMYQCISEQEPIDFLTRQKAIDKDDIDPLIPAVKSGHNHYTKEFLELLDWMLTPDQKDAPQHAKVILEKLEHGLDNLAIADSNKLQSDIPDKEDDEIIEKDLQQEAVINSNNKLEINTDHSNEISVTKSQKKTKPTTKKNSFVTVLWLVIAIIPVVVLILVGLSLKQPLQYKISKKDDTDHQGVTTTKKINTETIKLKAIKENPETVRLDTSIQQNNVEQKAILKQQLETNISEPVEKINPKFGAVPSNQEILSEHHDHKDISKQQIETEAKNQIKQALVEKKHLLPEVETVVSPQQQIQTLLAKAKIDIKQLRLSTPKGKNALEKYQKVLQLAPKNKNALQGITIITEKYLQLAKINQQQQNYGNAIRYLKKAITLQPNHPEVINIERNFSPSEPTYKKSPDNNLSKTTNTLPEFEMVWIGPGCFQMGDNEIYAQEHEVCLTRGFNLGKYEVTQSQWKSVMNNNPSVFKGDNKPVQNISWNQVQTFLTKLNEITGKRYRLPTEAEWEYACRNGGKQTKYCGSNNAERVAWYKENSDSKIHPIGQKQPNRLGLYDMSGNVWEWVQDWYQADYYSKSPIDNPIGPLQGTGHVVRGGSWFSGKNVLRSAYRVWYGPGIHVSYLGFRIAR